MHQDGSSLEKEIFGPGKSEPVFENVESGEGMYKSFKKKKDSKYMLLSF